MKLLFSLFLDICLLRKGPQDLPDSSFLLALALFLDLFLSTSVGIVGGQGIDSMVQAGVAAALLVAFLVAILYATSHVERLRKTVTAALGCDALITLAALPITAVSDLIQGVGFMILIILLWNLVVFAHILRHALGVGYALGFALSFLYAVGSMDLMANFFAI